MAGTCLCSPCLLCNHLKHWVAKWRNLEWHWHIKCLSMKRYARYLSQLNFFEQTFDWQLMCIRKSLKNHIFDHGSKCLLGSVISIDESECVAKFHFASVVVIFHNFCTSCRFWSNKWMNNQDFMGSNESLEPTQSHDKKLWPKFYFIWNRSFVQDCNVLLSIHKSFKVSILKRFRKSKFYSFSFP